MYDLPWTWIQNYFYVRLWKTCRCSSMSENISNDCFLFLSFFNGIWLTCLFMMQEVLIFTCQPGEYLRPPAGLAGGACSLSDFQFTALLEMTEIIAFTAQSQTGLSFVPFVLLFRNEISFNYVHFGCWFAAKQHFLVMCVCAETQSRSPSLP